jgi:hypothetical protein
MASALEDNYKTQCANPIDSHTYEHATSEHQVRLSALGVALGTATRSGMLRAGYADDVVRVFQPLGSVRLP